MSRKTIAVSRGPEIFRFSFYYFLCFPSMLSYHLIFLFRLQTQNVAKSGKWGSRARIRDRFLALPRAWRRPRRASPRPRARPPRPSRRAGPITTGRIWSIHFFITWHRLQIFKVLAAKFQQFFKIYICLVLQSENDKILAQGKNGSFFSNFFGSLKIQ